MKLLIAVDMEGISGVVNWEQVTPGHEEYNRFRHIMTSDVNAAVRGAMDAGVQDICIVDGHAGGRNVLLEELDPRVSLNCGSPSPLSMVEGVSEGVDAVMFVGYHARVGSLNAILDHTWSKMRVANVWLNGNLVGEIGLNAAVCGQFGAPVIMISGDQTACDEAKFWIREIETAIVKHAHGRMSAECLPLIESQQRIYQVAMRAIQRFQEGAAPAPLSIGLPVTVTVELTSSVMADNVMVIPFITRLDGRRVEIQAPDMVTAYKLVQSVVGLAND